MSDIAPDKTCFSAEKCSYFSYISMKTYVVGTHWKRLSNEYPHHMFSWRNKKKYHTNAPSSQELWAECLW